MSSFNGIPVFRSDTQLPKWYTPRKNKNKRAYFKAVKYFNVSTEAEAIKSAEYIYGKKIGAVNRELTDQERTDFLECEVLYLVPFDYYSEIVLPEHIVEVVSIPESKYVDGTIFKHSASLKEIRNSSACYPYSAIHDRVKQFFRDVHGQDIGNIEQKELDKLGVTLLFDLPENGVVGVFTDFVLVAAYPLQDIKAKKKKK